jgi:hypothetical protein
VVHGNEFHIKRPKLLPSTLGNGKSQGCDAVLLQLGLDQGKGQSRANKGNIVSEFQKIGNGTNVVFVAVGEDHRNDVIEPVTDGFEIGQNQVNAWLCLLGKENTAVHDEQFAIELTDGHVPTDFTNSP